MFTKWRRSTWLGCQTAYNHYNIRFVWGRLKQLIIRWISIIRYLTCIIIINASLQYHFYRVIRVVRLVNNLSDKYGVCECCIQCDVFPRISRNDINALQLKCSHTTRTLRHSINKRVNILNKKETYLHHEDWLGSWEPPGWTQGAPSRSPIGIIYSHDVMTLICAQWLELYSAENQSNLKFCGNANMRRKTILCLLYTTGGRRLFIGLGIVVVLASLALNYLQIQLCDGNSFISNYSFLVQDRRTSTLQINRFVRHIKTRNVLVGMQWCVAK